MAATGNGQNDTAPVDKIRRSDAVFDATLAGKKPTTNHIEVKLARAKWCRTLVTFSCG
jgi:hypothetical protein